MRHFEITSISALVVHGRGRQRTPWNASLQVIGCGIFADDNIWHNHEAVQHVPNPWELQVVIWGPLSDSGERSVRPLNSTAAVRSETPVKRTICWMEGHQPISSTRVLRDSLPQLNPSTYDASFAGVSSMRRVMIVERGPTGNPYCPAGSHRMQELIHAPFLTLAFGKQRQESMQSNNRHHEES